MNESTPHAWTHMADDPYWSSKLAAQLFGWMVFVTFLLSLVSGHLEPFLGALIAMVLFVPPIWFFDHQDATHERRRNGQESAQP